MTERIVALDPGGTTGWAMWQDTSIPNQADNGLWENFTCGQMETAKHHLRLHDWLEHLHTQKFTVVDERFEFRKGDEHRAGINLISREYIGVAELFCQQRDVHHVMQQAASAKGFVTNDKLKVMGLYVPGKQHAMDAMRHLIYYMVNRRNRWDLIESWKDLT